MCGAIYNRHTAITQLVQAGLDLSTATRISGHKSFDMALSYSRQNGKHINAAIDKLEEHYRNYTETDI